MYINGRQIEIERDWGGDGVIYVYIGSKTLEIVFGGDLVSAWTDMDKVGD